MKIKNDLVIRQISDTWVVLPIGQTMVDFKGMLCLNETGAFLWNYLEKGCDKNQLLEALTAEYAVGYDDASADVDEFIKKLVDAGCLDNE